MSMRSAYASGHTWLGKSDKRRGAAFVFSIGLHCLLVLWLISSAKGELVSGGQPAGPEGPVFEVVLTPPPMPKSPSLSVHAEAGSLRPLIAKYQTDPTIAPVALPPLEKTKVASLTDLLAAKLAKPITVTQAPMKHPHMFDPGPIESDTPGKIETASTTTRASGGSRAATSGPPAPNGGAPSSGALWGRVEPCWRSLGLRTRATVILDVFIDNRGGMSVPPRIVRDTKTEVSERQLRAEAAALSALAACLPKGDLAFRGQTQRLEFRGQ